MSENVNMQPKNIFEQILFGQLTTNNNVVALSKNVEVLNDKIEGIMALFSTSSGLVDVKNPVVSGDDETVLNK